MSETESNPIPAPPPINLVGEEVPCSRCGYSLRGLAIVGRCPECGWPVEASLNGNLLRYADPAYLDTLQRGIVIILWSVGAQVLLALLIMCAVFGGLFAAAFAATGGAGGAAAGAPAGMGPLGAAMGWVVITATLIGSLVAIASTVGYWLLTTPDAASAEREQPITARRLVRICAVVSIVIGLGSGALQVLEPALATGTPGPTPVPMVLELLNAALSLASTIVTAVHFFAMMRYVRWLAGRVPDPSLVEQTRLYIWLLPVLTVVGMFCFGLGPLVAMVLYVVMLWRLRTVLVTCRELARQVAG